MHSLQYLGHLGNAIIFLRWQRVSMPLACDALVLWLLGMHFVIEYQHVIGCNRTGIFVDFFFACVGRVTPMLNPDP